MPIPAKPFFIVLLLAIAVAGIIEFNYAAAHPETGEGAKASPSPTASVVPAYHIHADVSVVVDGKRLPFTDFKYYQNPVACNDDLPGATPKPGEIEAHFHNGNDQVAHFHDASVTWTQFWHARKVELTPTCLSLPTGEKWCNGDNQTADAWQMMINGKIVAWNANVKPADLDRVLFWFGPALSNATSTPFEQFVSKDACIYSNKCPERGTAPAELCGQTETQAAAALNH